MWIKKETKAECPAGCDHLAEVCSQYAHRDTSWVDTNDSNIYYLVDACDLLTNARKVEESKMCPKGCSHTKDKCEEYTHETVTVQLRNGKTVKLEACDKWSDTLNVAPDTTLIPINNFTQLKESLNQIEDFAKKNAVKVVIYNPLEVNSNGFSVLTNFKNLIANSNGKIIAEWRGNFICPPENNIILTSAKWEEMGKPVLGINPDNSSKYDIYSYEKSKFTNYLGVLNIVVLPIELEIYNSATLANAATVIEQNRALPENERAQATVTFTGGTFNLNNGGDIQNLTKIMTYFNDSWAYFSTASTGKLYPATDSISVSNANLLGELGSRDLLKTTTIDGGKYFFVQDSSTLGLVPANTFVRTQTVNASNGVDFNRAVSNEVIIDAEFNVQGLRPLDGKWQFPIKLTPVTNASKPGGEWNVVGVDDWFLSNYNEPNSAFYSNTPLILGAYTSNFTSTNIHIGINLSALNIDTLNNSYHKIKASDDKVNDNTLRILPKGFVNRKLNIGGKSLAFVASDGRLYIDADFVRYLTKISNQMPEIMVNPAYIPQTYCFSATDLIVCHENYAELLYDYGETTFCKIFGLSPITNVNVISASAVPAGKQVYKANNGPSSLNASGIQYQKYQKNKNHNKKVIWRTARSNIRK